MNSRSSVRAPFVRSRSNDSSLFHIASVRSFCQAFVVLLTVSKYMNIVNGESFQSVAFLTQRQLLLLPTTCAHVDGPSLKEKYSLHVFVLLAMFFLYHAHTHMHCAEKYSYPRERKMSVRDTTLPFPLPPLSATCCVMRLRPTRHLRIIVLLETARQRACFSETFLRRRSS